MRACIGGALVQAGAAAREETGGFRVYCSLVSGSEIKYIERRCWDEVIQRSKIDTRRAKYPRVFCPPTEADFGERRRCVLFHGHGSVTQNKKCGSHNDCLLVSCWQRGGVVSAQIAEPPRKPNKY